MLVDLRLLMILIWLIWSAIIMCSFPDIWIVYKTKSSYKIAVISMHLF